MSERRLLGKALHLHLMAASRSPFTWVRGSSPLCHVGVVQRAERISRARALSLSPFSTAPTPSASSSPSRQSQSQQQQQHRPPPPSLGSSSSSIIRSHGEAEGDVLNKADPVEAVMQQDLGGITQPFLYSSETMKQ
ncbi:hypothetical protein DPX16_18647 [Anabarilius grahami]|uniref:Uncharacterized protein n=1 Tax=Anabarilius grahami TaxID=495550 RepID=A0A3N0YPC5_ANAGA|nr:hypothetical protein DPX16_18647 [Anabarilius grahami]